MSRLAKVTLVAAFATFITICTYCFDTAFLWQRSTSAIGWIFIQLLPTAICCMFAPFGQIGTDYIRSYNLATIIALTFSVAVVGCSIAAAYVIASSWFTTRMMFTCVKALAAYIDQKKGTQAWRS